MNTDPRRILIIGASRGLGLGLVETYLDGGWEVIATIRGPSAALSEFKNKSPPGRLRIETLDMDDQAQLAGLKDRLGNDLLDVLFISAGTTNWPDKPASQVAQSEIDRVMNTNAFSPIRIADSLIDRLAEDGSIVFMSSIFGSVANNKLGGTEVYRASKAALNMLVSCFAIRHRASARPILLMHPGWVQTDMGGPRATLDVATSVHGMAVAIEARKDKPGLAFIDYQGQEVAW